MEKLVKFDKYITINQKLLVEVKVGDHAGIFDSRIEDMEAGDSIMISMPTDKGRAVPLAPNTRLHLSYVMDMGRFSFKSIVLDRVKEPRMMLKIAFPDAVFRQELRSFFRVDTRLSVKVMVTVKIDDVWTQKLFEGKVVDMSGGGLRMFTDIHIEKDATIEIYFLGSIEKVDQVKAQVMRCRSMEGKFEVGVRFVDISQTDRDRIIKYVFKRQVEQRKLLG
ncbi:flagellar brake protein [Seleniivibrio woodruffii]|uniref:C-di-GMP-binding flagellar brake protein YcgR n=1 Tax=Seleniivibrio woodruffii TaxID=1078050 RepID=A0A4R1KER0_9BACT|nr:flagellar brake protein [Seleniivibrio woodruffii]TCK62590.1 c-di-GMP-binding flagellar brake protein YcgR [Seleniivibrio woodruffii]TVZ36984.1 c-di-GMP-binding flagellar brake protein YcgR [Seleniivibrio woodruffii]